MGRMHRAGDILRITGRYHTGEEKAVSSVRMYATDNGYYFRGVDGLIPPKDTELVRRHEGPNPCGSVCERADEAHTCYCCRGVCWCEVQRSVAERAAEERGQASA